MIRRSLSLFLLLALATACAGKSQDIYFRSRIPTGENPHIKDQGSFGLNLEVETERFVVKPTENLVTDFKFHQENSKAYFMNDYAKAETINGLDLSLGYSLPISLPVELAASFDFIEMKLGLLGYQEKKSNLFLMFNGGYYKTAAYVDDGGCSGRVICFLNKKEDQNSGISSEMSGYETKIGGDIGYFTSSSNAIYLSYNWMDYHYEAKAHQETAPNKTIAFDGHIFGMGTGIGYMMTSGSAAFSFSLDNVRMFGFSSNYDQLVYGIKFNL